MSTMYKVLLTVFLIRPSKQSCGVEMNNVTTTLTLQKKQYIAKYIAHRYKASDSTGNSDSKLQAPLTI